MSKAMVDVLIDGLKKGVLNMEILKKLQKEGCQKTKEVLIDAIENNSSLLENLQDDIKEMFLLWLNSQGSSSQRSISYQLTPHHTCDDSPPSFKSSIYNRKDLLDFTCKSWIKLHVIDPLTPYHVFKEIFSGNKVEEKVICIGNINCLCYLIKKLFPEYHNHLWAITAKCFVYIKNGELKPFTSRKLGGVHLPAEMRKIMLDEFVEELELRKKSIKKTAF